jgi:hypothetical protein
LIFVLELRDIWGEVKHRQLTPAMRADLIDLARIEAKTREHGFIRQLRLGVPLPVDVAPLLATSRAV